MLTRFALALVLTSTPSALQQLASPLDGTPARWDLRFDLRGTSGTVDEVVVFNDGFGARVFYEEVFDGTTNLFTGVTVWDGAETETFYIGPAMYPGEPPATVDAFLVYDDGSGPVLLAGGTLGSIGTIPTNGLAVFDGESWSEWPGGPPPGGGKVRHMVADGAELFVAADRGDPYLSGPVQVSRWTGSAWETLGGPLPVVLDLELSTVGGTRAVYAMGLSAVRRFDGAKWPGIPSPLTRPRTMVHYDDGTPQLVVGGDFEQLPLHAFDGSTWTPLGSSGPNRVTDLAVRHRDGVDVLYACGAFDTAGGQSGDRVAYWDGVVWRELGGGLDDVAMSIAVDPFSRDVVVSGWFQRAGSITAPRLARWNGRGWAGVSDGEGLGAAPGRSLGVGEVLEEFDIGNGPALYLAGSFGYAGSSPNPGVAVWGDERWHPVGTGLDGTIGTLEVFDSGSGPELYAGGRLDPLNSVYLARFDGASWQPVPGFDDSVYAMEVFDDGTGPALFVSGGFTTAGGVPAYRLARFDGSTWSALAGPPINGGVQAFAVHDDGTGSALFAGGNFYAIGNVTTSGVAKWNGTEWAAVGSGLEIPGFGGFVSSLDVVDLPNLGGERLIATGAFPRSGNGTELHGIGSWDGVEWKPVGNRLSNSPAFLPTVYGVTVFDEGAGPRLVAVGSFTVPGSMLQGLARLNGATWEAIPDSDGLLLDATVFEGALWVGGAYIRTAGEASLGVARRLPAIPREPVPATRRALARSKRR